MVVQIHTFQSSSRVQQVAWIPQKDDLILLCCQSTQDVPIYNLSMLPLKPTRTLCRESRDTPREVIGNTCCHFLRDASGNSTGHSLLASDAAGYIRLWDLRTKGGPKWAVSADAGLKAAKTSVISGEMRPRDDMAPGPRSSTLPPRVADHQHCAVKHLGQLSSDNEFQAMLASGMLLVRPFFMRTLTALFFLCCRAAGLGRAQNDQTSFWDRSGSIRHTGLGCDRHVA
jgi:hypothetical protein